MNGLCCKKLLSVSKTSIQKTDHVQYLLKRSFIFATNFIVNKNERSESKNFLKFFYFLTFLSILDSTNKNDTKICLDFKKCKNVYSTSLYV